MGFFNFAKKKPAAQPGLQIRIAGPGSIGMQDRSFNVTVELGAGTAQTVSAVRVRLVGEYLGQQVTGAASNAQKQKTFAEITSQQQLMLLPRQPQQLQLAVPVNNAAFEENMPPEQSGGQPQGLDRLQTFAHSVDANSYQYFLLADVTVHGWAEPASVRVPTLVTRPQGGFPGGAL